MEPKAAADRAFAYEMNPEVIPNFEPKHDFALLALLFVVAVLGYVGLRTWRSRRISATARPVASSGRVLPVPSLSVRFQLVREMSWLMVPFVVIGSFGIMTDPRALLAGWGLSTTAIAPPLPPTRPMAVGVDANPIPVSTVSTNVSSSRPAWVNQPRVVDGDCEQIVLTSQQYSTREEAEQELRVAAVRLVEEDLQRLQSGPFRPTSWRPAADDVVAHAVKKRYDDVNERDFGSFTHPMHRASWLVELSPAVRTEFMPAWRRAVISFRILFVAGVASLFAMAASASVMYFRLDSLTQGRARGPLKLLTGGLTAGWLALVATSFSQGHLW